MQMVVSIALALALTGQSGDDGWQQLRRFVGASIFVRDAAGNEILGRLSDLTGDSLTVDVHGDTRSVLRSRTCEVATLARDPARAIGWIAGLALAGLAAGIVASKTREGITPVPFTLAGAGLGALVTVSASERHTVYKPVGVVVGCRV